MIPSGRHRIPRFFSPLILFRLSDGPASVVGQMSEMSKRWLWPSLTATALVVLTTAILLGIYLASHREHLIFGYLVPMVIVAARYGRFPTIVTAVACDLCAAYFLYPPDFSFYISDRLQIAELGMFSLLALTLSQLADWRMTALAAPLQGGARAGSSRSGGYLTRCSLAALSEWQAALITMTVIALTALTICTASVVDWWFHSALVASH
jgi:K+-sensing histidine kinase KdpD